MKRLICKLPRWMGGGHKRMKHIPQDANEKVLGLATYRCPRCGYEQWRKVKVKPNNA